MVKWTFEDDCLAPQGRIKIEYRGKNPFGIVQKAGGILRRIFEVEAKDFWERDFRWDSSSDPRSFFVRNYLKKGIDFRSSVLAEIVFQGNQPADPEKEGVVVIYIGAQLTTEYNLVTRIQKLPFYRGLLRIYNFAFYNKVRRNYLVLCNDWLARVNREFRLALNLPNA
jgi:hypothetical protein